MERNVSVMFDIKALDSGLCKGHPLEDQYGQIVVDTIQQLSFPNDKVLALILFLFLLLISQMLRTYSYRTVLAVFFSYY